MRNEWLTAGLDVRKNFIVAFLRNWYAINGEWPKDYEAIEQFLTMFDDARNSADIEMQKAFKEHMNTCVRPLIIWQSGTQKG